ncbi:MAG: metallophosphoesterase family protein [Gaiellaceae bacterium]
MPSRASRTKPEVLSSRTSRDAAGWGCTDRADPSTEYEDDTVRPGKRRQFSWISPKPLWESRNDKIARWLGDTTHHERMRWVEAQRRKGVDPKLPITRWADDEKIAFMILGDPGEGDDSQYQVLRPLRATSADTDFTFIVSDVIYPAGDWHEYRAKFYWPYKGLPGPIYAVPGNHDWYDGLSGFMMLLCGADPDLRPPFKASKSRFTRVFRDLVWREPSEAQQDQLERIKEHRPEPSGQRLSYFAIELKELVLVGIDTGIQSGIDAEQGEWLRKISSGPKDKILLTGKPLVVDARRKTCPIEGGDGATVNEIVDDPSNRYIAVIGGDIHNFQRYPVRLPDGRVIQHIVTGAAGAYTKATHTIPTATIESCGCTEDAFRCYPRRGDSLAAYSILLDDRLPFDVAIDPELTPVAMKLLLDGDVTPNREEDRGKTVPADALAKARRVRFFSEAKILGPLSKNFSEFLDWNRPPPPLFKSFLKVETGPGEIEIRCFAATGCEEHADNPPLEDHVKGTRGDDGTWTWEVLLD